MLHQLPEETAVLILSLLSKRDLLQAALVSKSWKRLCNDESLWRVFVRHLQLPPPQPHLRVSPLTTTSSSSFSASSSSTSSSAAASASSSVSPSRSHLPKQKWAKQCSSLSRSSPNVNLFLERQQQPSQQLQLQLQQPVRRLLGSRAAQLQRQRKGSFGEELFYGRIVTIDHPFLNAVDDVAYSGNSINAVCQFWSTATWNRWKVFCFCIDRYMPVWLPLKQYLDPAKRDVSFYRDQYQCQRISAGTMDKIIVGLTNERHPDPELVYALLLTYKSHISAASLLEKLIARFYLPQLESTTDEETYRRMVVFPVRFRVFNVLKLWVSNFFLDFTERKGAVLRSLRFFLCRCGEEETFWLRHTQNLIKMVDKECKRVQTKLGIGVGVPSLTTPPRETSVSPSVSASISSCSAATDSVVEEDNEETQKSCSSASSSPSCSSPSPSTSSPASRFPPHLPSPSPLRVASMRSSASFNDSCTNTPPQKECNNDVFAQNCLTVRARRLTSPATLPLAPLVSIPPPVLSSITPINSSASCASSPASAVSSSSSPNAASSSSSSSSCTSDASCISHSLSTGESVSADSETSAVERIFSRHEKKPTSAAGFSPLRERETNSPSPPCSRRQTNYNNDNISPPRSRSPPLPSSSPPPSSRRFSISPPRCRPSFSPPSSPPLSCFSSFQFGSCGQRLLKVDVVEMAHQLTLMDWDMFAVLEPREFIDLRWEKETSRGEEQSSNLRLLVDSFHRIAGWVATTVMSKKDPKSRARTVKFYIRVALECQQINNYNTLMAIVMGLRADPVHRLHRTWASVPAKYFNAFQELVALSKSDKGLSTLRWLMNSCDLPALPYVGMYLADLSIIENGAALTTSDANCSYSYAYTVEPEKDHHTNDVHVSGLEFSSSSANNDRSSHRHHQHERQNGSLYSSSVVLSAAGALGDSPSTEAGSPASSISTVPSASASSFSSSSPSCPPVSVTSTDNAAALHALSALNITSSATQPPSPSFSLTSPATGAVTTTATTTMAAATATMTRIVRTHENMINFAKYRKVAGIISKMLQFQSTPYELRKTPLYYELQIVEGLSMDTLYDLSLQCEPKQPKK